MDPKGPSTSEPAPPGYIPPGVQPHSGYPPSGGLPPPGYPPYGPPPPGYPPYGGQPQQQQQQQVVVLNQPTTAPAPPPPPQLRGWSTGICGCCEDCGSCLYGYFCMPCMMCTVASQLGENCCVPICLVGGHLAMRTKLRTQYGIHGSICEDSCLIMCCADLSMCQMYRELRHVGR
ncbi:hypothetical protein CAPTEDRAFT_94552 [Capitella teleta]|uniref:Uncharacterized protein n=1 Tax=Capitella teleta TaxID=283909 RepID=R7UFN4_CAPTE|nr:hypothetical protein CAPTEDRAFT_94552 [Capitella teleta]|eukprot:ELU04908.1 hypothetical protein CAPTEDRAFT_94552 [Capitella teleta]